MILCEKDCLIPYSLIPKFKKKITHACSQSIPRATVNSKIIFSYLWIILEGRSRNIKSWWQSWSEYMYSYLPHILVRMIWKWTSIEVFVYIQRHPGKKYVHCDETSWFLTNFTNSCFLFDKWGNIYVMLECTFACISYIQFALKLDVSEISWNCRKMTKQEEFSVSCWHVRLLCIPK